MYSVDNFRQDIGKYESKTAQLIKVIIAVYRVV